MQLAVVGGAKKMACHNLPNKCKIPAVVLVSRYRMIFDTKVTSFFMNCKYL
jgi:hypothetical protein